jgi:hypothetical protein
MLEYTTRPTLKVYEAVPARKAIAATPVRHLGAGNLGALLHHFIHLQPRYRAHRKSIP